MHWTVLQHFGLEEDGVDAILWYEVGILRKDGLDKTTSLEMKISDFLCLCRISSFLSRP